MASGFVPLVTRSEYSLLSGGSRLGVLVEHAARLGHDRLGLTDLDALYGIVPFHKEAVEHGLVPVHGATLEHGGRRVVALIRDAGGYQNVCQLISRIQLEEGFDLAASLPALSGGLHLLVGDPDLARILRDAGVPRNSLWIEMVRPDGSITHERRQVAAAAALGLGLIASGDVRAACAEDLPTLDILAAIRDGAAQVKPVEGCRDRFLRSAAEMEALFADLPEAIANTRKVAEDCRFVPIATRPIFPAYALPPGESAVSLLYERCHAGLQWRYRPIPPRALTRLAQELEVIDRLGFCEYFLVVKDIVAESRRRGVPIAGRGSGASSLVAYVLGITNVCPLQFNLSFERFLNEKRTSPPDLDIDFCWRIRDEIIDTVFQTFGRDRVAMVCTYITLQPRSAFREAAKVHGYSDDQISQMRRHLPGDFDPLLATAGADLRRLVQREDRIPRLGDICRAARRILGFPQHLSVHPGGVVIGQLPIDRHTPVQRAEKGVIISQYDKDSIEEVGLVKIDLLGNRTLSTIHETLRHIEAQRGEKLDIESFPDEDLPTLETMRQGNTVGCGQLESPAMRNLLQQMQPRSVRHVMIALALIRPGAASLGMKEEFIKRHRGLSPWQVPHPALDDFLTETYGIMVYEDDAMLVASALAGITLEEGDRFRKAIQKCPDDATRLALSRRFLGQCRENGVAMNVARDLWIQMAKFNAYSFCKSHAASYARLAYAAAYLKTHEPQAFWVATLNNSQGLYDKRVYIEEIKRAGIPVRLPCVNRSGQEFTLDGDGVRIGLGRIRGLEERAMQGIVSGRSRGAYQGVADLLSRVKMKREDARALILAGALDFCGQPRPRMILEMETSFDDLQRETGLPRLFALDDHGRARGRARRELGDFTDDEKFRHELELLELSARGHILTELRGGEAVPGTIKSGALRSHVRRDVSLIGVLDACRRTEVKSGDSMEFLTLEDEEGIFECTLFPDLYRKYGRQLRHAGPYRVWGTVEDHHGAITLNLTRLEALGTG